MCVVLETELFAAELLEGKHDGSRRHDAQRCNFLPVHVPKIR